MPLPEALMGESWTRVTARASLPILVWCAKNGKTITYGKLDAEIIRRGLGHHVIAVQYGYPAGAIGSALIETEEEWEEPIPPLNALVVNARNGMPGKGVNYFLEHYYDPDKKVAKMSVKEKRAVIEEIHADIFAYEYWDDVLELYGLSEITEGIDEDYGYQDEIDTPKRGGWSSEGESSEHEALKNYIAQHPVAVGLSSRNKKGKTEYLFPSGDKADVVFKTPNGFLGVEVKSITSNEADINRGIFQAVKYQSLLRAEQKAELSPPTARAVLVTEHEISIQLQNLADILGIEVYIVEVNNS